ncbi:threonine--tRNA ligase [Chitinispirillales bacterium ANBcel5]|uniref:threonine--tRNA ligase n=1 Tax=Cellulosispirillum alkaliphilum TaxID=3039283 RepID=UPI002A539AB3|nr:threonine--tRNA ligase [Chitinispirillales bacterium ANBcel5]
MNIILPDGRTLPAAEDASCIDVAKSISPRLAKAALACRVNGELKDTYTKLKDGDQLSIITFDDPEGKAIFWHSSSHILAQAVQELYPDAKIAIGPAIENGFYYDFDVEKPFTPDEITAIEKRAKEIIARKITFDRNEVSKEDALELFKQKGESYKLELIEDLEGKPTLYNQGEWVDLCRGPHIPNSGYIKAFKLLSVAGAYWRGDEKRPMLQRIYGISFPKQSMLDEYLTLLEEAQKRDHRKLGKELNLFSFHNEGVGFPFWHPNGMVLYNSVMDFCRKAHVNAGYQEIKTPIILNEELWRRSGHWDKYRDNMYFTEIDEKMHAVKPMNCPGGLLVYRNDAHSYRKFPIKYCEFGLVHRHEKAGVLHGLFRVRQFTQDDAHIFCLPNQIEEQISEVIDFITMIYRTFGFEDYKIELSTRPEQYIGSIDIWNKAEEALKNVLESSKIDYQLNPGDGAFYGPKIDFHIKDVLKRSWQCGTIQLDFSMPERFDLEYTDADGEKKRPVMIHRALLGSMERFIGILLEHYGGALPLWLSPVQCRILPISDKFSQYANSIRDKAQAAGLRVELDERNEKIGYKIRDAELKKIPFMAIVGEKEQNSATVSLRRHGQGDKGSRSVDQFISELLEESFAAKTVSTN